VACGQRRGSQTIRLVFDAAANGSGDIALGVRKRKLSPATQELVCAGLRDGRNSVKKLSDNNGISVHLTRSVRWKEYLSRAFGCTV